MTERLTIKSPSELIHFIDNSENGVNQAIKKLAEYEDAEEQGRLIILPCKIGSPVYKIMYQRDNFDDRLYPIVTTVNFTYEMIDQIGKTVFYTPEEAEEKLLEYRLKG